MVPRFQHILSLTFLNESSLILQRRHLDLERLDLRAGPMPALPDIGLAYDLSDSPSCLRMRLQRLSLISVWRGTGA